MASRNLKLVREALGMGPGQPDLFWARLHPDVEWDLTEAEGAGATYRGREAVRRFMASWRYGWEVWRVEPEDYIDAGEHVITVLREPDPDPEVHAVHARAGVWTLSDEQVVRFRWYRDADDALRALGLSP